MSKEKISRAEIEASQVPSLKGIEIGDSVAMLLNSIPSVAPLSLEEAQILSIKIKAGRNPETGELNESAKLARDAMVFSVKGMIVDIAKKNMRPGMSMPDAIQQGFIAAQSAAEKYDPKKGYVFVTYAHDPIYWAIAGMMHRNRKFYKQPTFSDIEDDAAGEDDFKIEDKMDLTAINGLHIEKNMEIELAKKEIGDAVESLTDDREKLVLKNRIGIKQDGTWGEPATLEEIGNFLGVSRARIQQIQWKAVSNIEDPRIVIIIKNLVDTHKRPSKYTEPVAT